MFLLPIKLDRVSFQTTGRQNLQKYADFLIESIVFCPLVPPSWISLVDPTSAMYASAIYVSYIYGCTTAYYSVLSWQPCCNTVCYSTYSSTSTANKMSVRYSVSQSYFTNTELEVQNVNIP